jgi:hypothetical protein
MRGIESPSELLGKYGCDLVTLVLADRSGAESTPVVKEITLVEAIVIARVEADKLVDIIIHTDEGDIALTAEQVAALVV